MNRDAARRLWSALLALGSPLYAARLRWRARREPLYGHALGERFGRYAADALVPTGDVVWLHAVSLGETRAASSLVAALRHLRPNLRLLLTHGTATGRDAGAALLRDGDAQAWLPFDRPAAVAAFLDRYRPRVGVLMETEIWPNLLHAAAERRLPMVLANARLSERSAAKGRRFEALLRPAVESLALVLAQSEADGARLRTAGARHVVVAGNLKFDVAPDAALVERGRTWRSVHAAAAKSAAHAAVVLAASTREGEEAPLLDAWRSVAAPRPLLLLVPRHPQRFDEVASTATQRGFAVARRSAFGDAPPPQSADADVWLGDSLGEMPMYYAMADVALLGGSFEALGGQNLIEAAACGCPVVMGPHTFNFADASKAALAAGAARRVTSIDEGVAQAVALTQDAARDAMVEAALAYSARYRGAALRMAGRIVELLPQR